LLVDGEQADLGFVQGASQSRDLGREAVLGLPVGAQPVLGRLKALRRTAKGGQVVRGQAQLILGSCHENRAPTLEADALAPLFGVVDRSPRLSELALARGRPTGRRLLGRGLA
jgi:hypothetical protein